MSEFIRIFEVVLPVILLVVFGFVARKLNLFDEDFVNAGSRLVFKVFLPINMFFNIFNASGLNKADPKIIIYAVLGQIIILFLAYIVYKKMKFDNETMAVMLQTIVRSNIVLFGLSIAQNYFDSENVAIVTIYIGIIAAFSNGFAIIIYEVLTNKDSSINYIKIVKAIFKNPIFVAAILGIVFNLIDINIYEPVIGLRGPEMFVMIILFAAPVAVSSHAMSIIYTSKGDFCAMIIVYTTILNSITIFLSILILSTLGII